jgi:Lysophospholipase L1 and related esterases
VRVVAAIVLAAGCLPLAACSVVSPGAPAARAVPADAATESAAPVVVAIGDSITHGKGVTPAEAWPNLLAHKNGWVMTDLGINGAGFIARGSGGGTFETEIARVAALRPDLIIVSGSRNDLRQPLDAIAAAVPNALATLRADAPHAVIVAISAIWNDHPAPEKLSTISARVRDAAPGVRAVYLDIGQPFSGHPALLQSDDIHPTAAGQQALADAVDRALAAAHVRP